MVSKQKYSDENLIGFIHKYYEEFNRVPSSTDLTRADDYPFGSLYTKRFGSYKNALDIAGLKRESRKNNKYTDNELLEGYKKVYDYYSRQPTHLEYKEYYKENAGVPSQSILNIRIGSFENINDSLGLKTTTSKYVGYNKEFLISELQRFEKEHSRPPICSDFNKGSDGYPSNKCYVKEFGSYGNALVEAGFDYRGIENFQNRNKPIPSGIRSFTKEKIKECVDEYISIYNEVPSLSEIKLIEGYPDRNDFQRLFGGYVNALKEFGYKPKYVQHYTNQELENEFMRFVEENNRIPAYVEFNNSDYPSFWCYQNRFGSWNKAVKHYGFEPNKIGTGFCYEFEDGEIIKSRFEYNSSFYLRKNGIKYDRDVLYKEHIGNYHGRKNCDYVIDVNGKLLFIEIAGFITDCKTKSSIELQYIERFENKLDILNKSNLTYKVLYPKDFETRTMENIFSFLKKDYVFV